MSPLDSASPPGSASVSRPEPPSDNAALLLLLGEWLPEQRWFAGGAENTAGMTIEARLPVAHTDAVAVELAVIAARTAVGTGSLGSRAPGGVASGGSASGDDASGGSASGDDAGGVAEPEAVPVRYHVLLGWRTETPERVAHAIIGAVGGHICYDALHDADVTSLFLTAMASGTDLGALTVRSEPGSEVDTSLSGLVISAEQSNTSVIYGDQIITKFFRRLQPGINPDAEVLRALHRTGHRHHARPVAEFRCSLDGAPTTVALATEFFANSADGWAMATASVRDLMGDAEIRAAEAGGDFASEARRLGETVALAHRDLADLFGTSTVPATEVHVWVQTMVSRAERVAARVPELRRYLGPAGTILAGLPDAVAARGRLLEVQRIHGDLHLGQTLRTLHGWALIDFEGEPSASLLTRRSHQSPLRDVAGMLRSFDYAAQHLLITGNTDEKRSFRAAEWATRNRSAFLDGYAAAYGADPRESAAQLAIFELDKAIYEVGYEHDHRPGWERIPLAAVAQLTAGG